MATLKEMYRRTTSCKDFDKMLHTSKHFLTYFGLNHFYYTRVLETGEFTSIGTNLDWHDYVFDHPEKILSSPIVSDYANQQAGVVFLKNSSDQTLSYLIDDAYSNYQIHFTIGINRKTNLGLESFGFGTNVCNLKSGEHLLKELPLVNKFLDHFLEENANLVRIAHENQVKFTPDMMNNYVKKQISPPFNKERILLLKQLGLDVYETLTEREREILRYVAQGFPAAYVAKELFLSTRTVENYVATIKAKLHCNSKIELLRKANDCHALICEKEDLLTS